MKYFQCPRFCTYACSFKILYLVGERAGRLLPRDLKISPRSTRLDIPSACPHARLLWRVLPVAGAGSWGRLLVQHSSSRAAIEAPAVELWLWLTQAALPVGALLEPTAPSVFLPLPLSGQSFLVLSCLCPTPGREAGVAAC